MPPAADLPATGPPGGLAAARVAWIPAAAVPVTRAVTCAVTGPPPGRPTPGRPPRHA